jgi:hypothetical protein
VAAVKTGYISAGIVTVLVSGESGVKVDDLSGGQAGH